MGPGVTGVGHVPPGHRQPLDLSSSQYQDNSPHQIPLNPVFLNPMSIPFPGPEKVKKIVMKKLQIDKK